MELLIERPRLLARFIRCVELISLAPMPKKKLEEMSYDERLMAFHEAWERHRRNRFAISQSVLTKMAEHFNVDPPTLTGDAHYLDDPPALPVAPAKRIAKPRKPRSKAKPRAK